MEFFRNPKLLYFTRIGQLVFAIAYLILVSWCGTHRAWWSNINGPLALGVITTIFTFVVTGHGIYTHHRKNPFTGHGKAYTFARLGLEILIILMWIGTAALMIRPRLPGDNEIVPLFPVPPDVQWTVCIVFAFVEVVSFFFTTLLVFLEDHTGKTNGGTTATYV